jgi:hypothetical protein
MATMDVLNLHGGSPANFVCHSFFPFLPSLPFFTSVVSAQLLEDIFPHSLPLANPQLDVGGGATADAVKKAFELLLTSKDVKSIFVNICTSPPPASIYAEERRLGPSTNKQSEESCDVTLLLKVSSKQPRNSR